MADMNALVRNPIVLGGVAVIVLAAAVAGGYFLGTDHGSGGGMSSGGTTIADNGVCQATLARVQDYGITDAHSQLTSTKPTTTDIKNRVVCNAKDGATTYAITVDVLCSDMTNAKCLKLYHVSNSAGDTLFQRTKFLKPT